MKLDGFEHAFPKQLSGGMQQRVAIARALAPDPQVLLMDEPFGALDAQTRVLMQEMLEGLISESHGAVVFVTHDIDEALIVGDTLCIMSKRPGRLLETIPQSVCPAALRAHLRAQRLRAREGADLRDDPAGDRLGRFWLSANVSGRSPDPKVHVRLAGTCTEAKRHVQRGKSFQARRRRL